jgi:ATP-dependent DNA helicase RecG
MNVNILTDSDRQRKGRARRKSLTPPPPLSLPSEPLPLQYFKGVGPARAQLLARFGIRDVDDLVQTYPRGWEDRRVLYDILKAPMGEKATLRGTIRSVEFSTTRSFLGIASALLEDASGTLQAVWFKRMNPRYDVFATLRQQLQVGRPIIVFGPLEFGPGGRQIRVEELGMIVPETGALTEEDQLHFERIVPLYSVTEGLQERFLRSLIGRALRLPAARLADIVPGWLADLSSFQSKAAALQTIHFPRTLVEKEKAREALAFEEFLVLETALGLVRREIKREQKSHRYLLRRTILTPFRERLGFELTGAQKRVIREIFDDMMQPYPMNRLLQGDVGSGKTLVALCAMLLAVENGGQAALMAPTEILAEQHAITFSRYLSALPVRYAVLTGRQTPTQKKKLADDIEKGKIDLVIGTHALIQKHIAFPKLMLAVIDEQHRFGVEHRSRLRHKGAQPDILVMTATPIPRTLALTVYGDLDASILDELPPGRQPIETQHVDEDDAYQRIRTAVSKGHQAYIVYPLVEESDKIELKAVVQEAETLRRTVFPDLKVGVLHGQLSSRDKEAVMEKFRTRALDVLIATTIIEVGIDIPNATVMAIQHAERFGLATLHQLRGRVGRGQAPSTCLLIAEIKNDHARRRIRVMTETTDGFRISEEDLSLRGPGEVLGVMQHGTPEFKVGNLARDGRLIQQARQSAENILLRDPRLDALEHQALRQALFHRFDEKWRLGLVG